MRRKKLQRLLTHIFGILILSAVIFATILAFGLANIDKQWMQWAVIRANVESVLHNDDWGQKKLQPFMESLFSETKNHHKFLSISIKDAQSVILGTPQLSRRIKPSSVLVISGNSGQREFSTLTKLRLEKYCNLRGYQLQYFSEAVDKRYTGWWQKVVAVSLALKSSEYRLVAWLDDDTFITNFEVKMENFLELPAKASSADGTVNFDPQFFISIDTENQPHLFLNSGAFIVRNTDLMRTFFTEVLNKFYTMPYLQKKPFHDQSAITIAYYEMLVNYTLLLPMCVLQSFDTIWSPNDFLMHVSGIGNTDKMKYLSWMATHEPNEWTQYSRSFQPGQCTGPRRAHWEP